MGIFAKIIDAFDPAGAHARAEAGSADARMRTLVEVNRREAEAEERRRRDEHEQAMARHAIRTGTALLTDDYSKLVGRTLTGSAVDANRTFYGDTGRARNENYKPAEPNAERAEAEIRATNQPAGRMTALDRIHQSVAAANLAHHRETASEAPPTAEPCPERPTRLIWALQPETTLARVIWGVSDRMNRMAVQTHERFIDEQHLTAEQIDEIEKDGQRLIEAARQYREEIGR